MTRPLQPVDLIVAAAFLVGGLVLGVLLYKLIAVRLRRDVTISQWGADDLAIAALRRTVPVLLAAAGGFFALVTLPLDPVWRSRGERLLLVVAVIAGTMAVARLGADGVRLYSLRRGGALISSTIFVNITRLVLYAVGGLVVLQSLGVSITPMLTALGVGGLAVALALQDTLANLFAGFHILGSRKLNPGDYIQLDSGQEGYVVDINWRNTSVRQLPNNLVVVPNAKLASAIVTNYYRPQRELSVLVDVGVSYDSDLEHVERVTIEVARETLAETPGGVADFDPFIRFHTFDEYTIGFTVILRVQEYVDQYLVKHEFVKRLHRRYRRERIRIPFPIRTVQLRTGDRGPFEGDDAARDLVAAGAGPARR